MQDEGVRIEAMANADLVVYGIPYGLAKEYHKLIFSRKVVFGIEEEEAKLTEYERSVLYKYREMLSEAKKVVGDYTTKYQRAYYKKYNELTGYSKKYMDRRKANGLCVSCGKPVDDVRFVRCSGCRRHVEDWSELMKWVNDIGKTGEWLVKQIIKCLPNVVENYVLPNGKRIEFYWADEDVGIDVTVTHSKYASSFYWSHLKKKVERYAEYLSELHIVVVEDKFSYDDYRMLNDRVSINTYVYNFRDIGRFLPVKGVERMECGFRYIVGSDFSSK